MAGTPLRTARGSNLLGAGSGGPALPGHDRGIHSVLTGSPSVRRGCVGKGVGNLPTSGGFRPLKAQTSTGCPIGVVHRAQSGGCGRAPRRQRCCCVAAPLCVEAPLLSAGGACRAVTCADRPRAHRVRRVIPRATEFLAQAYPMWMSRAPSAPYAGIRRRRCVSSRVENPDSLSWRNPMRRSPATVPGGMIRRCSVLLNLMRFVLGSSDRSS